MSNTKLLTVKEYAEQKGINPPAVYKRIQRGEIKATKKGRLTYVEVELDRKPEESANVDNNQISQIGVDFLEKRILDLENGRTRDQERIESLEQDLRLKDKDLREKDKLFKDSLQVIQDSINSKHEQMLLALQNIGAGHIANIGLQKRMGHFDNPEAPRVNPSSTREEPVEEEIIIEKTNSKEERRKAKKDRKQKKREAKKQIQKKKQSSKKKKGKKKKR